MAELDKYTKKAIDDPEFRKKVLKDANKAIKEEFGEEPPCKVTYHTTDSKNLVFVLPPENYELNEKDLESASGGIVSEGTEMVTRKGIYAYACYPDINIPTN